MLTEFKDGVHLTKADKLESSERYLTYLRNRYESKACQFGVLSGVSVVWVYLLRTKMTRLPRIVYATNLFVASYVFVYEMVSKMYTDREKVNEIDNLIYKKVAI
jgi:hypothetical protein